MHWAVKVAVVVIMVMETGMILRQRLPHRIDLLPMQSKSSFEEREVRKLRSSVESTNIDTHGRTDYRSALIDPDLDIAAKYIPAYLTDKQRETLYLRLEYASKATKVKGKRLRYRYEPGFFITDIPRFSIFYCGVIGENAIMT